MDSEEFRIYGKQMVDYVADYWLTVRERKPLPAIKPGYIADVVPAHPPTTPESWEQIFEDLEKVVMEGTTHWHHPGFFSYFPAACSYQAIMADILSGGLTSIGFSWKSSPAMTELEMATLDWLVEVLNLPEHFKNSAEGPGCGIIQCTASDSTMIAILTARARAVEAVKAQTKDIMSWLSSTEVGKTITRLLSKIGMNTIEDSDSDAIVRQYHDSSVFEKLIVYCSDQAHSSVDKGALINGVRLRKLKSSIDEKTQNYAVKPETLEAAIKEDRSRGLIPFIMVAAVGSTNTCGFDRLDQLGPICEKENIWLHVDAAYAGSFLSCPEFRYLSKGVEYCDSFNFNAHKAMMINFDCSPMWFKNGTNAAKYLNVDPVYLRHEYQSVASDYRHLQVALSRRFRSLKIWFVIRNLGIQRIQENLRTQNNQAAHFAKILETDSDRTFELFVPQHLGLVCFKVRNSTNEVNEALCNAINSDNRIHLIPSKVHGTFFLRLAVCSQLTTFEDIDFAFKVIKEVYGKLKDLTPSI